MAATKVLTRLVAWCGASSARETTRVLQFNLLSILLKILNIRIWRLLELLLLSSHEIGIFVHKELGNLKDLISKGRCRKRLL